MARIVTNAGLSDQMRELNLKIMVTSAIKNPTKVSEVHRLWIVLKYVYGLVPIVAGLDKFTNIVVDWSSYLSPGFAASLPMSAETFMLIVGVIEVAAGFIVLFKTELGAYIVSAWLICIALSLLLSWHHPDVAVRDIVMAIGAFTLARLTKIKDEG